tara:strand:+ start:26 stop:1702 length:1677 start_codon:yes stop_codon:yes gene_type:complete
MCGIAGVVSREKTDVGPELRTMLEVMHHRGPNGAGYVVGNSISRGNDVASLDWERAHGPIALGHTRLAVVGGPVGTQPFIGGNGRVTVLHNGEIYNYTELRPHLEGKYTFTSRTDSEVLAHLIADHYIDDLTLATEKALSQCDGVYAVAATDGQGVIITRDPIGVRQLYVGQKDHLFAFASEKKSLWAIGIEKRIQRLLPGQFLAIYPAGIMSRYHDPAELVPDHVSIADQAEAVRAYRQALEAAVAKRIQNQERIGIIFSGGIDSLLIAQVARHLGANITCYTAGHTGSSDLQSAAAIAREMGLELRTVKLTEDDVFKLIPKIIHVIEDRSLGQIEVAVPVFAAVRAAYQDNQLVLLTGQGADELFGGYPWYRTIVEKEGYAQFQFRMKDDLLHLYKETLEREDKIAMAHSIELRVPYLDPQVISVAMGIAPEFKVFSGNNSPDKHIHRELSVEEGISPQWAMRPKEAAQHGAGIHDLFDALAERHGFSPELAKQRGYSAEASLEEKLGSSSRYGYRYGDPEMWKPQDHVQLFLDSIAYECDLLNEAERTKIEMLLS